MHLAVLLERVVQEEMLVHQEMFLVQREQLRVLVVLVELEVQHTLADLSETTLV
jgi:hypothetical protein